MRARNHQDTSESRLYTLYSVNMYQCIVIIIVVLDLLLFHELEIQNNLHQKQFIWILANLDYYYMFIMYVLRIAESFIVVNLYKCILS